MKKLLLLLSVCCSQMVLAQNLVPNWSFEIYDTCPNFTGQIRYATYWFNYSSQDPEYFNPCSTNFSTPNNNFGYQIPYDGKAYCGLYTFYYLSPFYREYISAHLLSPLIIGQKYYLNFKVCLADNINVTCGTNNIGALFTTQKYYVDFNNPKNFSHIYADSIILDTLNWKMISGSFIADSSYQYISIGIFFDIYNTSFFTYDSSNHCAAYYYIDEVCVSSDSLICNPPNAIKERNEIIYDLNIFPNPAFNRIKINCSWSYENCEIEIYDLFGKMIRKYFLSSTENEISLNDISPGFYLLHFFFGNKTVIRKLIIN